jgi:hypothetical protein
MKFLVTGISMFNRFIPTLTEQETCTFSLNIVINYLLTKGICCKSYRLKNKQSVCYFCSFHTNLARLKTFLSPVIVAVALNCLC